VAALEKWLRTCKPQELFDQEGRPAADIIALCPLRAEELIRKYEDKLPDHREFVVSRGIDPPEISDWAWKDPRSKGTL
jgi:phosphoketolase